MPDEKPGVNSLARYLRPDKFDVDPSNVGADAKWMHWFYTFENFLDAEASPGTPTSDLVKLRLLANHLSASIYAHIKDCKTYTEAIQVLKDTFSKPKNEILARHILATRKQTSSETIADYSRELRLLAQNCGYQSVTAAEHESQAIRGAFIAGLTSMKIKERLLETPTLTLAEAIKQAQILETAQKDSQIMGGQVLSALPDIPAPENEPEVIAAAPPPPLKCFFCGGKVHRRIKCPAFRSECQNCGKVGHFSKVCRSTKKTPTTKTNNAVYFPANSVFSAASPSSLKTATVSITVNDTRADALIDTGSSVSFIDKSVAQMMKIKLKPYRQAISLASLNHTSFVDSICFATLTIDKHIYKQRPLLVVNNLCADVIVGHDLLKDHSKIELQFGGSKEPLQVCVMEATVPPASIFTHLSADITPIAIKSRRRTEDEEVFIREEISKLLEDRVIEPSISPWRAQVLVAGGGNHRKRLVIDYSQTINKFTYLDAYPLPNIESIVSNVAKFKIFSQIDLKSAYHQVPILEKEKIYTAFEADGKLYQFTRIPFGVTNGVAAFQRTLEYIINQEKLDGTFVYLDDVTVCGKTQNEHDDNLQEFMKAATKYKLTLNKDKCNFNKTCISLLGYTITNNVIEPDKDRLEPLLKLPLPTNASELKRALGLFAHYAKWVKNFSAKIQPLVNNSSFPLDEGTQSCFQLLKSDIRKAALVAIDNKEILTVETDASDFAIAATLSQRGRPIAFFSRTLTECERKHASVEKEACAIVESLRKWRHLLISRHFILITDQQSVSHIFDQKHSSKIKNDKFERWRLELSCYKYDIVYRPGVENVVADALSRVCAYTGTNKLMELHDALSHPGITRMYHYIKTKNLPYTLDDIKQMTASCRVCAEVKPRFAKAKGTLIKAIAPFERLSIDFKGPLPSTTPNKYILTVIDEFSRYPFAFPCRDMTAATVIECLKDIFFTFGQPLYIHSDRGSSFMSEELQKFLRNQGIASSRTTPYNPQGNGQVERLNGTLWRTIQLNLKSRNLPIDYWELALKQALHCVRSLLCTAINTTPHERIFNFPRRTPVGESIPSWLVPGPILMRKNVRSKTDPIVEEVELLHSNPTYSYVRQSDGRESTVSNRQLAPLPSDEEGPYTEVEITNGGNVESPADAPSTSDDIEKKTTINGNAEAPADASQDSSEPDAYEGRPSRTRRIPSYLNDYILEQAGVNDRIGGGE